MPSGPNPSINLMSKYFHKNNPKFLEGLTIITLQNSSKYHLFTKNLYKGNICLDFGSAEGSSSLYSRSNGIIEAGGLILQSKQIDSENIWGNLENKIIFKNFNDLENLISQLLNNEQSSNDILSNLSKNFKHSRNLIEIQLDKILKTF